MTAFKNTYTPARPAYPPNVHLDTLQEDYDYNFMFEVKTLNSDRVELRPFLPSRDAQALLDGTLADPALANYLNSNWQTLDDVCAWAEEGRASPASLRYAIYTAPLDNLEAPSEYVFAGTVSLLDSSVDHMQSEIGWLIILTPFQRTHVMTHAVGLLMHRILDAEAEGGLGLRRCQWKAHSLNTKSRDAAVRMGFLPEGIIRALIVVPPGKPSIHDGRPGRLETSGQRDTFIAGVTWYDWEEGKREHVDKLMARRK